MPHENLFVNLSHLAEPRARVICLPNAGGGTSPYRSWAGPLSASGIEVVAAELPGRESKLDTEPFTDLRQVVDLLSEELSMLSPLPYAVFGHSMGALIGYELTRSVEARMLPMPRRLFLSSHRAAHIPAVRPFVNSLPTTQLIARLRDLGGTPTELLDSAELMEIYAPAIRADFAMIESYSHQPGALVLSPVTVLSGADDSSIALLDIEAWDQLVAARPISRIFPGSHFYHLNHRSELVQMIGDAF